MKIKVWDHPTFLRYLQWVRRNTRSSVKTPAGVLEIIKKHRYPVQLYPAAKPMSVKDFLATKKQRQDDAQFKRAAKDPVFRRELVRDTKRAMKVLAKPQKFRSLQEATEYAENKDRRRQEFLKLRATLMCVTKKPEQPVIPELGATADPNVALIYGFSADTAKAHGVTGINMAGKDAVLDPTARKSYGVHHEHTPARKDRRGKWVGFERAKHCNYVRSFALISRKDPRVMDYVFHNTEIRVTLPEGYVWSTVGGLGLKVVNGDDDLHVDAGALLREDPLASILSDFQLNAENRRYTERRRREELESEVKDSEGVYVCLCDSIRAGNCSAGSRAFARLHGIGERQHVHAPELLTMANGDIGRVRLAVTRAKARQRQELESGYSELCDHYPNFG
jgi:hypothetical protein